MAKIENELLRDEPHMENYEQYEDVPKVWSWVLVLGLSGIIIAWAMAMHHFVDGEAQREWDFGQLPDTPAKASISTHVPAYGPPSPGQIPPLPGARHGREELKP